MPSRFFAAFVVGATLGLAATGCSRSKAGDEPEEVVAAIAQREAKRVLVEPARVREMVRRLETTARVESEREVSIFPRLSGVVVELAAEEGERVAQGQLLARLDDRELEIARNDAQAARAEARANLPKLELAIQEAAQLEDKSRLAFEQAERDHERNLRIGSRAESDGVDGTLGLISQKELEASKFERDQRHSEQSTARLALERAKLEAQAGKAALERAELALERAELNLSFARIEAPLDGVIASRSIKVGDLVSSAGSAFVVTDPELLRVVFYRPQRELLFFQRALAEHGQPLASNGGAEAADGLAIRAFAEALAGLTFHGVVERISPTIDAQSGNFRVTGRMQVEGQAADGARVGRLLPGMLLRLDLVTERRANALCVPKRALRREGESKSVFVVQDGVAHRVEVEEGLSDDEFVEVHLVRPADQALLAADSSVVVVGNRDLEDGVSVKVEVGAEGAAAP